MALLCDTEEAARRLLERIQASPGIGFDTEFSGARVAVKKGQKKGNVVDATRCRLTGFSVATEDEHAYVPVSHRVGDNLDGEWVDRLLRACADRPILWAHGLKAELLSLGRRDLELSSRFAARLGNGLRDSAVAAWQLNSDRKKTGGFKLKVLRQTELGLGARHDYEQAFGKDALIEDLSPHVVVQYAALDALDTYDLGEHLWGKMDETQRRYHDSLEMPLAGELARIARVGVPCDASYLEQLRGTLEPERRQLEADFLWWTGCRLSSRKEKTPWLRGRWPDACMRWNKDGTLSDKEDVVSLALTLCEPGSDGHRAATIMHRWAELHKLEATYCDGLLRCLAASDDGRLHPQLNVITQDGESAPRTGRFSCSAPNLQNLPRPDDDAEEGEVDEARVIRQAFRPEEGWELTEADYKQVELCQLGHLLGGVGTHAEAARSGKDMHKAVGDAFGVTRYEGKHLNFAVIFQCGPATLSARSGKSEDECRAQLAKMKEALPEVVGLQKHAAAVAQERGYIRTMTGRRRIIPELRADRSTREGNKLWYRGSRVAFNTPIQGGARDIVAAAMPMVTAALRARGLQARVVMQVHDSLWFEHPATERAAVQEVALEVMPKAWPGLKVPLSVDVKSGRSLGDC